MQTNQFFVKREIIKNTVRYWNGHEWSALITAAKNYGTQGNASRAAKILARYYDGDISTISVKLPLFSL